MRRLTCVLLTVTLFWSVVSVGLAQQAKSTRPPAEKKPAVKTTAPSPAELQAKIHRTAAALIEARSAENPDPAEIESLTRQLQKLRSKLQAQGPGGPVGWRCPWGGPGRGYGPGYGGGSGPGPGYGRGPGRGYGPGPGYGRGPGRGYGPGPGYGRGPGRGYGRGPGWCRGLGYGPYALPRWGFVDEDGDGVCDNFEAIWGSK